MIRKIPKTNYPHPLRVWVNIFSSFSFTPVTLGRGSELLKYLILTWYLCGRGGRMERTIASFQGRGRVWREKSLNFHHPISGPDI